MLAFFWEGSGSISLFRCVRTDFRCIDPLSQDGEDAEVLIPISCISVLEKEPWMWLGYETELWELNRGGASQCVGLDAVQGLILSGILMVGVRNVWQLATVPASGLVLPASGLFVL